MLNLHVYTKYSGNEFLVPEKQLSEEYKKGKKILSVTDINCAKGNMIAKRLAGKYGIKYISGIEIKCSHQNQTFSVIGYCINENSPDFDELDKATDDLEYSASLERLDLTESLGFQITENDMWNVAKDAYHAGNWTGKMFAKVILDKKENKSRKCIKKYILTNGKRDYTAFANDYYSEGTLCYVRVQYFDIMSAVDIIHANGGKTVLSYVDYRKLMQMEEDKTLHLNIDYIELGDGRYLNYSLI